KVSEGSPLLSIAADDAPAEATPRDQPQPAPSAAAPSAGVVEVRVPDIGDFKDVPVIEVLVKPGDRVKKNDSLITLESEKASMEVPAENDGVVQDVKVKVGDKVSEGSTILVLSSEAPQSTQAAPPAETQQPKSETATPQTAPAPQPAAAPSPPPQRQPEIEAPAQVRGDGLVHASPGIRRFARELGVDLHGVRGSGPNGRITREDVQGFVKSSLRAGGAPAPVAGLPAWPKVDFAQYGAIERKPLSRIKKLSGPNLHRNWLQIPHITNQDEADVTSLEAFRNEVNAERKEGPKLTILAFLVKAAVAALKRYPEFNASLDGDELVYKRYYNIGFAADTPDGLIVPVIKNADAKGLFDIAGEAAELARKARDGKLGLGDMQGGSFTISSIGGIGGTAFTQIVNAPEVAILGATRTAMKPIWDGEQFVPRLMLPISVSYDHRVIDGAAAARFLVYVAALLADFRRVAL
ncbi:MAG: dihydrolipoyllysine-residue acetyltransferase, partial [Candidatus Eremiobacteraeota bacterium]|nr:dihydrolipoyllysine-residue acetyltransferase [Candidatus Eremiobacteraeota bacterium]